VATGSELIGRDGELARLRRLVDPPPAESRGLVLLGDAGMGKSILLADAARRARAAGLRVLQVTGRESEQELAFAGLHQLLRPVLDRVTDLPGQQERAAAHLKIANLVRDQPDRYAWHLAAAALGPDERVASVPSGLKPSVAKDQRAGSFPYVVPA
jgi:hypothetical protein